MNEQIFLNLTILDVFIRLFLAIILGMLLGIERNVAHKTVGLRTYALLSFGSALFIIISEMIRIENFGSAIVDPTRIAAQIITGVGFIGTGLIIWKEKEGMLVGLTTATGFWVATGIGMACGFGYFSLAIIATLMMLFVLTILWFVEDRVKKVIDNV
ncbi:MAG: MgtC/SapB family protein [Candidatus Pacebacteria bacterium]|nr:MgtC/SapB family protein [Candidatus Paceibacterota bacterium]MBP9058126.1 MgtC/SapB family protein [Candidatus Paceibacterota bacterium]MBP9770108.1 MgtC/SapB family protein [Candidatus Paceibacterota bacterium]